MPSPQIQFRVDPGDLAAMRAVAAHERKPTVSAWARDTLVALVQSPRVNPFDLDFDGEATRSLRSVLHVVRVTPSMLHVKGGTAAMERGLRAHGVAFSWLSLDDMLSLAKREGLIDAKGLTAKGMTYLVMGR